MLLAVVFLVADGVYWPLLLMPLIGFAFWKAWRRVERAD
jgi:hypothetical protein